MIDYGEVVLRTVLTSYHSWLVGDISLLFEMQPIFLSCSLFLCRPSDYKNKTTEQKLKCYQVVANVGLHSAQT